MRGMKDALRRAWEVLRPESESLNSPVWSVFPSASGASALVSASAPTAERP